jgi:hypothetical protein
MSNQESISTTEAAPAAVAAGELEGVALRVAQARSVVNFIVHRVDDADMNSDVHNTLGLVAEYLDSCAEQLSNMHMKQQRFEERQ